MINKIKNKLSFLRKIRVWTYLKLNYFSEKVVRTDGSKIIPYRFATLDLAGDAKIILSGGDLEIGCDRLRGSRAETLVRMRGNALWTARGGCRLSYGSTVEILSGAALESGYFTMNTGSTVVAAKRITLGNDVMIARNAIVFDSDFHPVIRDGFAADMHGEVSIGDHVWIGADAKVLKGVSLAGHAILAAGSICTRSCSEEAVILRGQPAEIRERNVDWSR